MGDHDEIREKLRFSILDSVNPSGEAIGLELMRMVKAVQESTLLLNSRLERHMEIEEANMTLTRDEIHAISEKVDTLTIMLDAFPPDEKGSPDVEYHRGYHMDRRRAEQVSAKMWGGVRQKLIENAAQAALVAVLVTLLIGAKVWIMSELDITQTIAPVSDAMKGK